MGNSSLKQPGLSVELLHFYDEFVECHDRCAFLLEAVACLADSGNPLDPNSVEGLGRLSSDMKQKMEQLRRQLQQIHEQSLRNAKID